jgi:hypothetical protein
MANFSHYYFAWVGSGETSFNGSHLREDELVFGFELTHEEGQFAELTLDIANPYVGLLSPGRPLWAWFSWSDGVGVYPLFFGRLIGIPDDLFGSVIKIKLVAKPQNYAAQQAAIAASLRVLPFYDPIFIDDKRLDDPNVVLEGYSALWHVDRITHAVTISDILAGEEGTVQFTQNDVFYDKVSMKLAGAPLLMCEIEAEVEWTQCDHTGVFELKTVSGVTGNPNVAPGITISGVTFPGDSTFSISSQKKDPTQVTYKWDYKNGGGGHSNGDTMEESGSTTVPFYGGEITSHSVTYQAPDEESGQGEEYSISESYKYTTTQPAPPDAPPSDPMNSNQQVNVEVQQDRKEAVYVALRADVQAVLVEMVEDEKNLLESLTMNSRDVVAAGAATASDGVYFPTARGQQSIEYLLMVCRAHLLHGSRIVEVEWECPFSRVIGLSCRMNATIEDPRLPGSNVLGKIVKYHMTGDGDNGEFVGGVTINSAVGNSDPFLLAAKSRTAKKHPDMREVLNAGTPVYVNEGYVDQGYQFYEGRQVVAATADLAYEGLAFEAAGIQLPITQDQILLRHEYNDAGVGAEAEAFIATLQQGANAMRLFTMPSFGTQMAGPPQEFYSLSEISTAINDATQRYIVQHPSWVEMEFKPVKGISTDINFTASATALNIPKQVDLGAT